jgi:hypothetical protein
MRVTQPGQRAVSTQDIGAGAKVSEHAEFIRDVCFPLARLKSAPC